MTEYILTGPIGEIRTASTAGGGTALTTTAAFVLLPRRTSYIWLTPRNFSTAVVCKYNLSPFLGVVFTTDKLAATANATDAGDKLQNFGQATGLAVGSMNTLANNNAIYVAAHIPVRGLNVVMGASVNAIASVMTVKFWNGTAWTAVAGFSDGTAAAGATLAQNGTITWTVPSTWVTGALGTPPSSTTAAIAETTLQAAGTAAVQNVSFNDPELYWLRIEVSVQLSATVNINTIQAMNRNTTQYAEIVPGFAHEMAVFQAIRGVGGIEALTDAGTANLVVNAGMVGTGTKFV